MQSIGRDRQQVVRYVQMANSRSIDTPAIQIHNVYSHQSSSIQAIASLLSHSV